jgi:hypothetical protein
MVKPGAAPCSALVVRGLRSVLRAPAHGRPRLGISAQKYPIRKCPQVHRPGKPEQEDFYFCNRFPALPRRRPEGELTTTSRIERRAPCSDERSALRCYACATAHGAERGGQAGGAADCSSDVANAGMRGSRGRWSGGDQRGRAWGSEDGVRWSIGSQELWTTLTACNRWSYHPKIVRYHRFR